MTQQYRYVAERGAEIRGAVGEEDDRTVEVVWSTGAAVYRPATRRAPAHIEELVLSENACRLERLNAGAPVLAVHRYDSLEAVLGSVVPGSARIEDGVARATLRFSRRPDVEPIWNDVRDGHLRACSVAYRVDRIEREAAPEAGQAERWRVVDWTPLEISIVPIGADPGARIRGFVEEPQEEERAVAEVVVESGRPDPPAAVVDAAVQRSAVDAEAEIRAAVERERQRVAAIVELGRRFSLGDEVVSGLVARGASVDEARAQALEVLAARSAAPVYPTVTTPRGGLDETETRRRGIEDALAHRALPGVFPLSEPAREYRGLSIVDIAKEFLRARGDVISGMSKYELIARAHTTSDFPLILANVANKSLRAGYDAVPRQWMDFCQFRRATDLKELYPTTIGEAPVLVPISEGQDVPRGTVVEGRESYRLSTLAVELEINDNVLINDNLDALGRLPMKIGAAAAATENSIVWGIFASNPTMSDGQPLFSAAHKNVAATGSALSLSSLGTARAQMQRQVGLDGKTKIDIEPTFIIVPPELRLVAEQLTASVQPANASDVTPESIRRMRVISTSYLEATTPYPWYLAASPGLVDTIEYARLEGADEVQIRNYRDERKRANIIQAVHYFAAKPIDFRGLFRNPGA